MTVLLGALNDVRKVSWIVRIQIIALVASVILPLWYIPLILKIVRRKSSRDVSLGWAIGVWVCLALMAPSGFVSKDVVWKTFNIANLCFFSAVVVTVLIYRNGKDP